MSHPCKKCSNTCPFYCDCSYADSGDNYFPDDDVDYE